MRCVSPVPRKWIHGGVVTRSVPCGQCLPCRINSRRRKTTRFLLEAQGTPGPVQFVTLTYEDDHLPVALDWDGCLVASLRPRDLQLWLKRLRKLVGPGVRWAAVGEYGDETGRPHYHVLLFGFGWNEARDACCSTWNMGGVDVLEARDDTLAYMAGYTVKKMTGQADERLAEGQHREFYRGPNPYIGKSGLPVLADLVRSRAWLESEDAAVDPVPRVLMHGGKRWPLDRRVRQDLAHLLGVELDRYDTRSEEGRIPLHPSPSELADARAADRAARRRWDRRDRRSRI